VYRTPTISVFPTQSGKPCTDYFVQMTSLLSNMSCLLSIWDKVYPIYIQHEVVGDHKFKFLIYKLHNEQLNDLLGRGRCVKTQLSLYPFYYADDDVFRPLWAIFRSQKCIMKDHIQSVIICGGAYSKLSTSCPCC